MIQLTAGWDESGDLAKVYERILAGEVVDDVAGVVRTPILTSWQRCRSLGLVPDQLILTCERDLDLDGRLLTAATPVLDRLEAVLDGPPVSVILTDAQARVLSRRAGDAELNRHLDATNIVQGFGFPESSAGTNALGTALAERRPVYVLGREHFADCMQQLACAAAPIRDPLSGRVEGVLDLTSFRRHSDPVMLPLAQQAADEIEQRLLEQSSKRERELLAEFLRTRRAAGEPVGPYGEPLPGPAPGADPTASVRPVLPLDPIDQAVLRARAQELIAAPHRVATEVTLSGGRTAVLFCREVCASGEAGIVVEAAIAAGPRFRVPAPSGPETSRAGTPAAEVTTPSRGSAAAAAAATGPAELTGGHRIGMHRAGRRQAGRHEAEAEIRGTARPPEAGPSAPASGQAPHTQAGLLLLGEPGVGRLALLARKRLELLYDASAGIGRTLDVTRTAEELVETVVPRFADFVAVDLPGSVLSGEEPVDIGEGLRRVALGAIHGGSHLYDVGEKVDWLPTSPQARCLETAGPVLEPDLSRAVDWIAVDPERTRKVLESGIHSLITVPLRARGVILGVVSFYRAERFAAFEDDDLWLAGELAGRAAVCIDNARRFTREHTMALAVQRSLLPRGVPAQDAVEVAHRYLPAQAGVGGDWFDVIPLSGSRVALVVGDVVGHGVHAATTMGRLRTAVHNFSALDLPSEELLTHLDDLVGRLDADSGGNGGIIGATCLYAVYDPVSRRCTFARAGHPPPALVLPDGTVDFVDVPAGPPLGLGGLPFEPCETEVPEGSRIVLYTDGLIESRGQDLDTRLGLLRRALAATRPPADSPEETCGAVLDALLPARPDDDVALLVARTRALDAERTKHWDVSADPAEVPRLRTAVTDQLEKWDLVDQVPTTELIVSELVTNAIRYGRPPIRLRLIRDHTLICEVTDGSSTSPRLRRARTTDEGGRGLFLMAQLAERWGTRYTADGKVIWTQQPLPPDGPGGSGRSEGPV
ncbi:SpoIIE family protein phosphatase [Streptomyces marokkonensis]|uniref:SpoIIE family protein phosphatase n=1 Tax=Streptomyces marokkonensis TaxID=324855 RepID=UPI0011F0DB4F|nr:SpoIIE family protein phosphatase [Streptomyces marokkonensis]